MNGQANEIDDYYTFYQVVNRTNETIAISTNETIGTQMTQLSLKRKVALSPNPITCLFHRIYLVHFSIPVAFIKTLQQEQMTL